MSLKTPSHFRSFVLSVSLGLFTFACSDKTTDPISEEDQVTMSQLSESCKNGGCPCPTPLGSIADGSTVPVFEKSIVECEESCQSKLLTCNNGVLVSANNAVDNQSTDNAIKVEDYLFACEVKECQSCSIGSNVVRHRQRIKLYNTAEVGCLESCENLTTFAVRTCNNGLLEGDASFDQLSCKTKECRCEFPDGSAFLSLGGKKVFYDTALPACGKTCDDDHKLDRSCIEISPNIFGLSGSTSFNKTSCTNPTNCSCRLPGNLGTINHGQTSVLSKTSTVSCGNTCPTADEITVKCTNGVLLNNSTQIPVDTTTFKYQCKTEDCVSCPLGNGTSVLHGNTHTFFNTPSPVCNKTCMDTELRKVKTCTNGTFTPEGDEYTYPTCTTRACKCPLPGDPTTTVALGASYDQFFTLSKATCTTSCDSVRKTRVCVEGGSSPNFTYTFNGDASATFNSCGPPTNCECPLPGTMGKLNVGAPPIKLFINHSALTCGKSCSQISSIEVRCSENGLVDTSSGTAVDITATDFLYNSTCTPAACNTCSLKNYPGTIANDATLRLYSKSSFTCSDKPENLMFDFKCLNGLLYKNGTLYNSFTDPNVPSQWFSTLTSQCIGCDLPWGGSIGFGASINAHKISGSVTNPCGQGCKMQSRKCLPSGLLDGDTSYNLQSCPPNKCTTEGGGAPPRGCLLPWQNSFVTPGTEIPMWKKQIATCGQKCETYFKLGRCMLETGRFDVGTDYIYKSCTEVCP